MRCGVLGGPEYQRKVSEATMMLAALLDSPRVFTHQWITRNQQEPHPALLANSKVSRELTVFAFSEWCEAVAVLELHVAYELAINADTEVCATCLPPSLKRTLQLKHERTATSSAKSGRKRSLEEITEGVRVLFADLFDDSSNVAARILITEPALDRSKEGLHPLGFAAKW
jgi:hypothetical protein